MAISVPAVGDDGTAAWADAVSNFYNNAFTWSSYVPALTAATTNPTLGSGSSATGQYVQVGNFLYVDLVIAFGTSGTNAGSGLYAVSLPISTVAASSGLVNGGHIKCAGGYTHVDAIRASATTVNLFYISAAVGGTYNSVTNAAPGAWTTNDLIRLNLTMRIA